MHFISALLNEFSLQYRFLQHQHSTSKRLRFFVLEESAEFMELEQLVAGSSITQSASTNVYVPSMSMSNQASDELLDLQPFLPESLTQEIPLLDQNLSMLKEQFERNLIDLEMIEIVY